MPTTTKPSKPPKGIVTPIDNSLAKADEIVRAMRFRQQKVSVWQFWEHGVTSSFIDRFQECTKQCEISYVDGWTPRNVSEGIEFGNCGHWVSERVYTNDARRGRELFKNKVDPDRVVEFVRQWVSAYEERWLMLVPNPTEGQLKQQEMVYAKVTATLVNYLIRYSGDFTGVYKPKVSATAPAKFTSSEGQFRVPYLFPDGRGTFLNGKRDIVFKDRRGGEWVRDFKYQSIIDPNLVVKTMPVNFQLWFYIYAHFAETGRVPKGAILDIAARPQHRFNPEKESLKEFEDRIIVAFAEVESYPKRFIRIEMAITKGELLEWMKTTLDPIMEHIRGWWEGRYPHYMSPKHVSNKYGLADVFPALVNNDFSTCYKRTKPFNELMEV